MSTLTDKYVHAATRSLPEEMRGDVADELRATLADRVEALLASGSGLDAEEAEYAAVAELDDPARMSAGYTGKPLHLIGPAVFPAYTRLLRMLLLIVLPIVAVAFALGSLVADRSLGGVIGGTVWSTFNVGVHLCFWVTVVWVLVEHNSAPDDVQANLSAEWTPDDLPEPPRERGFPLSDLVASLTFLGLTIAFLIAQHFISWFDRPDGSAIPILDPALWSGWMPLLLAILVAEAGFELVKHRIGRWTTPLAAANTALNLAFALPVWFLAARDLLLNPELVADLATRWDGFDHQHVNNIVIITVVVVAAWSIVDGWRKVRAESD